MYKSYVIDFSVVIPKSDNVKNVDLSDHSILLDSKNECEDSIQINEISSSAPDNLDLTIVNTEQTPSASNSCDKRKRMETTVISNTYNFRLKQKLRYDYLISRLNFIKLN